MIRPDQIPDEVVEAAAMAFAYHEGYTWGSSGLDHDAILETARALIGHGLRAWPEAWTSKEMIGGQPYLLLPLTQEKHNVQR